ncbi:MAG: ABC transporter ATP-binding protein [Spirochaetes bacterium]|nr:MAG: ABC transporter ATP-binding protein [Spirochaetota bacterium]
MEAVSVRLENVTKYFQEKDNRVVAVEKFSFDFPPGKLTTLLGPSGCGKTTTLRCIAGFYEPDEGVIFIGNQKVNKIPPYNRPTGTVFQNYALFPHMNVFENVAYSLRVRKLSGKEIRDKVAWGLKLLKLRGMENRNPDQLSGGQQQRVAIARVLVNDCKVLLLDEPLSNLDAKLRVYMREEIKALQERLGVTTIYVTHDQEEAMSISDFMVVMNEGRIEQIGNPMEIYKYPETDFVAEFIGLTNNLEGEVTGVSEEYLKLRTAGREIILPNKNNFLGLSPGDAVNAVIRPEMFKFSREETPKSLHGEVKKVFFLGSLARYEITLEGGKDITLDDPNPKSIKDRGDTVWIEIDPESLYLRKTG